MQNFLHAQVYFSGKRVHSSHYILKGMIQPKTVSLNFKLENKQSAAQQDQKEREHCRDSLCYGVVISKYRPERRTGKPACNSTWGRKELDMIARLNNNNKDISFSKTSPNRERMQEDRMLPLMSDTHNFPPGDLYLDSFFLAPLLLQGPVGYYRLSQSTHGLSLRSVGQTNLSSWYLFCNMPVWTQYP